MLNPEVCGKFLTCQPRQIVTMLLPAVSFHEKGGVLEGSEICRILPTGASGSAVKTEACRPDPCFRPPRPEILLVKIEVCPAVSDFPALPKYAMKPAVLKRKRDNFSLENSPLKSESRLSAVPTDQTGRTVARPHHNSHSKEIHSLYERSQVPDQANATHYTPWPAEQAS